MLKLNDDIVLKDYQVQAVDFSTSRPASLMSMKTGTGKSLVIIKSSMDLINNNLCDKVLVLCTKSALLEVQDDFNGKTNCRPSILITDIDIEDFFRGNSKIALLQYENFNKIDLSKLFRFLTKFKTACYADEAHKLKTPKAMLTRSMVAIRRGFKHLIFLTATPLTTSLMDLFYIVHILDKNIFKNKTVFTNTFVEIKMIKNWQTGHQYPEITGYKNLELLRELIAPVCFQYYPEQDTQYIEHSIKIKDIDSYMEASEGLFKTKDTKIHATRLIDLQQVVDKDENKLKLYLMSIKPVLSEGLITYCHFRETIDTLSNIFDRIGIDYRVISGNVSIKERREIKQWFNSDPAKKVLLISSAGSQSLNLQSVNNMFFYNIPFGFGAFSQAKGRIERLFSKHTNFKIHFILTDVEIEGKITGTVDRYKHELISSYGEITEKVFNAKEVPKAELTSFNRKLIMKLKENMLWVYKRKK